MASTKPDFDAVVAAAARLRGHARETPVLAVHGMGGLEGPTFVKAENLQIGGAFKFRGAYNRLAQLGAAERARGVVAWSSGNHAQGVAAAGRLLGIATTIVMPRDAPQIKIENTRAFGAEIVFYDRSTQSREEIARELARSRGATIVPSYDDVDVIAGQGTCGLEMAAQVQTLHGRPLDILLVPCGGGGLVAGCAIALSGVSPRTRVYCVEPEGFDDTGRSLASGKREKACEGASTTCDALMAPTPGELTWPINQRLLAGGLSVTDEMVFAAIRYAWRDLKLVVEPGGAVALAAVLYNLLDFQSASVGIVISGGNVDAQLYQRSLG